MAPALPEEQGDCIQLWFHLTVVRAAMEDRRPAAAAAATMGTATAQVADLRGRMVQRRVEMQPAMEMRAMPVILPRTL